MKRILLPTDFSENAWNAIEYALQLFKNEECTFYLLHTYTPIIYQIDLSLIDADRISFEESVRDSAQLRMRKLIDRISKAYTNENHHFESACIFGMLIPEIQRIVASKDLDYIVMGTKGATGGKEILFGSNTVHAFKNVKCPIIAVPEKFEFEKPHELLFPSDYEVSFKDRHLKPLLDIANLFVTRIHVLHVYIDDKITTTQQENKAILEKALAKTTHLFHTVKNQVVTDAIDSFQRKHKTNLLVMLNNKHSFFENLFFTSKINQIGFQLKVPFLVIPGKI